MIKGVRRKSTAIESISRYFQTVDLIISHFKREADREKIFEIMDETFTLKDLLISTASIHLYHNIGIRVENELDLEKGTVESAKKLELLEKKILFDEVKILLKDAFKSEIDMLYRIIELDDNFINLLTKVRKKRALNEQNGKVFDNLDEYIEKELMEIILDYNTYNFYDLIADLIGLTSQIKRNILEEGAEFKDLSVELEKKLKMEDKEDKFIELSTLNRIVEQIKEEFEFQSYKQLKMEAMPVRMLKKRIIEYKKNEFPVSIPGLESFKKANELKKKLLKKIENGLGKEIKYQNFEEEILLFLKKEIIEQLKTNPNDFIYFLQNLSEESFNELMYTLNKYGINNILNLIGTDENLTSSVKENMIRYNIEKYDIMQLNDQKKNPLVLAQKELNTFNFSTIHQTDSGLSLEILLNKERKDFENIWKTIEERINYSYFELKDLMRKKQVINDIFLDKLNLSNYSEILFLLNFENVLGDLVRDIFLYQLSKILRQLGRILESYLKISNEKALYLLALKKISGTTESEEWVKIKIEELVIKRIIERQKELVEIFNAENKPFLINGFILARLTETSLKNAKEKLKNESSPIYDGIKDLKLRKDLISPISYCLGFDMIKRLKKYNEERREEIEEVKKTKEREIRDKKEKIRKKQEDSTLNWIERRITYSLMRVSSQGINPNQLYWQEKDIKTITDNIKLHGELEGNIIDLISEYFQFSIDKINSMTKDVQLRLPNEGKIRNFVINTVENTLKERLGHNPNSEEIKNMLEGEKYEIAQKIGQKIGKFLDKAIYTKFKANR
ncbi:MAG: hypothetical protein EU547_00180 [Promethearchaeota archaeon]|nr:MAG: hypothetical protein EU547_00180 [Candidatus Lokiarchaeota archaeon]